MDPYTPEEIKAWLEREYPDTRSPFKKWVDKNESWLPIITGPLTLVVVTLTLMHLGDILMLALKITLFLIGGGPLS